MPDGCSDIDNQAFAESRKRLLGSLPTLLSSNRKEQEGELVHYCDDPKVYLETLKRTKEYQDEIVKQYEMANKRFIKLSEDYPFNEVNKPTLKGVTAVFEEGPGFKEIFWNFYEHVLRLRYNGQKMSEEFNQRFEEYKVKVRALQEIVGRSRSAEEVTERDKERSKAHDGVAKVLVEENIAKTEFIARAIVRAFLIDEGLDRPESARQADELRVVRNLESEEAVTRYLVAVEASRSSPGLRFTRERAQVIVENFSKQHKEAYSAENSCVLKTDRLNKLSPRGGQGD